MKIEIALLTGEKINNEGYPLVIIISQSRKVEKIETKHKKTLENVVVCKKIKFQD